MQDNVQQIPALDWAVLELPGVMDAVKTAAGRVSRDYAGVVEGDDLEQEGYLLAAQEGGKVRAYLAADEPGHLYRWVWSRLTDKARSESRRSNRTVPLSSIEAAGA